MSGDAVMKMLAFVARESGMQYVAVHWVEGGGARLEELQKEGGCVFVVSELLPIVGTLVQLDWADFYFSQSEVQASKVRAEGRYAETLRACPTLVRVVDDTYFYIYGRSPKLHDSLKREFVVGAAKTGAPA